MPDATVDAAALGAWYQQARRATESLAVPLGPEDCQAQSMPDASPTKWHLAHTSWFFDTFVLQPHAHGYRTPNERYTYLYNSYYESVGERVPRPDRGLMTRPTLEQVEEYRRHVDRHVSALLAEADTATLATVAPLIELGVHHEQQHQELIVTDVKHLLAQNPLAFPYLERESKPELAEKPAPLRWVGFAGGITPIGHAVDRGFHFDNEEPRHARLLGPFQLASRLVTSGEYLEFMTDGGYGRPELWLSDGWAMLQTQRWSAPLYWEQCDGRWLHYTLAGKHPVAASEPVTHVSYYEADAFARWAGARLAGEDEWELAAHEHPSRGTFLESGRLHPAPCTEPAGAGTLQQMLGDAWEWTHSAYSAYPGYRPPTGALGEYNGKFMCSQLVLRGGSCATPESHVRTTYRNFFHPDKRWQFSGIRLAKDA